jgi:hypothetical protein
VIRLLGLATGRFYGRHPWQLLLALTGISLGVGVYVGVDLASSSAARAFDLSASVVRPHHASLVGCGGDLDENVYTESSCVGVSRTRRPSSSSTSASRAGPGTVYRCSESIRSRKRAFELRRFRTRQPQSRTVDRRADTVLLPESSPPATLPAGSVSS